MLVTLMLAALVSRPLEAVAQDAVGTIAGIVIAAENDRAIRDVVVEIPTLGRTVRTDTRGHFSFDGLALGTYEVVARTIGYARFQSTVTVAAGSRAELAIRLPRITLVDTLVVRAPASEPLAFLEARATGIGKFVTAEELQRQQERSLGDILVMVQGARVLRAGPRAYITSTRKAPTLRTPPGYRGDGGERSPPGQEFYYASKAEEARGIFSGCYARVYLDNQLLNPGSPAEPVNINEYFARDLVGIEYYAGAAALPSRFARLNSTCGIVVLHTRKVP